MHVGAAAAVLVVAFVFFARGWIGGGDAKLAAATALWLGFDQLLNYLIYASLFGGVLTLAIMRFRLMPLPACSRTRNGRSACTAWMPACPTASRSRRGADDLSRHALDEIARHVSCAERKSSAPRAVRAGARRRIARKIAAQQSVNSIWIRAINHELTFHC